MTIFLDVRLNPVGGPLASAVAINEFTDAGVYQTLDLPGFLSAVQGRDVLLATHGFNVNRENGITGLNNWHTLLQVPENVVFVGILWPGDSALVHGIDYPVEPGVADHAAPLLARFFDDHLTDAATISFASHSLGARLVLGTVKLMSAHVCRVILMAGAIDDNCLDKEFGGLESKIDKVSVLASKKDAVLGLAFPLGNFFAGIIDQGHPWWRGALGRSGPAKPRTSNFVAPFQIPGSWDYGHHHYLEVDPLLAPPLPIPTDVPPESIFHKAECPADGAPGWQPNWSAAFASTRLK
jgi:hypothetical protein